MSRVQEFQYIAKNILFYTFFKYNEHFFYVPLIKQAISNKS